MYTRRVAELRHEAWDRANGVAELFDELIAASACSGAGTHRDPANIQAELHEEIRDLRATLREARDEIEREARGLQP